MKDLVRIIVQALVENPEQVDVQETSGNTVSVYEVRVAKEDLGKVIGKNGQMAGSMRNILNAAHAKINKRAVLEIVD